MANEPISIDTSGSPLIEQLNNTSDSSNLSLESLVLLVNTERLKHLENKITKEFTELKERQGRVSSLHKLIRAVNSATTNDEFDCSNNTDTQGMLKQASEYGVEINTGKFKYNKEERERLIENIRLSVDDYNVLNDMQLQTVTRLMTERYESYQLARACMKPLHEDKINKARAFGGR
ncbi:MAG: hypothetical protein WCF65_09335 [Parachlamydiaceae bacterium]